MAFGVHFWSLELPLERLGRHLGSFWGSWGAVGVHFGGLGVPLGAFGAQWPSKTVGAFQRRAILSDFGVQRVPKSLPKWS